MAGTRDALNAFLDVEQVPVASADTGLLEGLRLAVKDIYDVAGYKTGCGNPSRTAGAWVSRQSAPAVQALLDAGARFVGKTQTDELAFSLFGQNAHFPHPVNPAAPDRVTGGSSSGSAAAVAGGLADIALGSDTGGSIRAPASFCGLIGLRTTHGRIPLRGIMPLAPSLDTIGWFAADIETYETVGKILLGRDTAKGQFQRAVSIADLDAQVFGVIEKAETERMKAAIDLPFAPSLPWPFTATSDELYWCFRQIQAFEAWAEHGAWISTGERELGPGVEERFGFGASIDPRKVNAERVRRLTFQAEMAALVSDGTVLVLPTVPGAAPYSDSAPDTFKAYRERALHLLCLSGLSGLPQITLPLGSVEKAPFGLSIIGPAGSDIALIRLARRVLSRAGLA